MKFVLRAQRPRQSQIVNILLIFLLGLRGSRNVLWQHEHEHDFDTNTYANRADTSENRYM